VRVLRDEQLPRRPAREMRADGAGTVDTLRLDARGVVAALLWPLLRRQIRRALERENAGLKKRCEAGGR
jgi:hypothetical protein